MKYSETLPEMTGEVLDWIRQYIPDQNRDPMNTCIKLTEEVSELMHAIHTGDGNVAEEVADCLVLLLDVAALTKVNLVFAFHDKMVRNRKRTWKKKNGALKHETD